MVKNQIQEDRMKSYFITSAKEIIRGEGMRALSVRTVAEKAGYSYATLYNYFKDLRELVFYCIVDFLKELREFVDISSKGNQTLLSRTKSFCNYFVQYPGTFSVIFTEQMSEIVLNEQITKEIDYTFVSVFSDFYNEISSGKGVSASETAENYKLMLIGLLSMYILRREPQSYDDFLKKMEKLVKAF